ncbi:MFS transporter [Halioxenophilus sp. WMMB6]|uniref:MFS transporter n=1 Tax=Halioxenophilus sp. WMMB6 TaxID=3073815 RepID=UPI00295E2563|nr:MFS transporter [Halioxenophilus sp. WMMB6]
MSDNNKTQDVDDNTSAYDVIDPAINLGDNPGDHSGNSLSDTPSQNSNNNFSDDAAAKQRESIGTNPYPSGWIGWYSTVLLALLYWLSLLDRSIISLLVDPIKKDLGISDVQFGMLHGMAFAVTFSLFGLLAGTIADRFNRRWVVFTSVTIWSLATAACGVAHNFWQLLLARVGVGAGEAGLNPSATSMISDLFPPEKLTLALAIYALGASVGVGTAFLFGGVLVEKVAATAVVVLPLIGEVKSWQAVFFIIGLPGLFISLLSFTMPEPSRKGVQRRQTQSSVVSGLFSSYRDLLHFIGSRKQFFMHHYLGFGLASVCFVGGSAWYPAHMARAFHWPPSQIGLGLGVALVVGGILGKLLCGFAIGVLYRRGYKDAQFRWYGGCLLAALPMGVVAGITPNPWLFLVLLGLFVMLLAPLNAVYIASLNLVTPNELRGAGVAFFGSTVGLLSLSLGPILVAVFSDWLFGGDAIGLGLALLFGLVCPVAAVALLTGSGAMHNAVVAAEQWTRAKN